MDEGGVIIAVVTSHSARSAPHPWFVDGASSRSFNDCLAKALPGTLIATLQNLNMQTECRYSRTGSHSLRSRGKDKRYDPEPGTRH